MNKNAEYVKNANDKELVFMEENVEYSAQKELVSQFLFSEKSLEEYIDSVITFKQKEFLNLDEKF